MKKIVLSLALVGLLGAGVYITRALGFTDIAGILDAQAKTYTAEYQAAKDAPIAE
jgi:hypothetical protein